ncbi:MAG: hypothetical protein IH600_14990 [Bacteroidetes bacterium]|nr:hypothetical protein [Bacteroidota bacterium]
MEIELFDDVELRELTDNTERLTHHALAESLNLDIQMEHSGNGVPCPYMEADKRTRAIYTTVFDQKTKLADYKQPIPTRVLMLIQIGLENGWWTTDDLWVRWSSTVADPILYRIPDGESSPQYSNRMILIARWADALLSFPELVKLAAEKIRTHSLSELREKAAKLQARIDNIDDEVQAAMHAGDTCVSTY